MKSKQKNWLLMLGILLAGVILTLYVFTEL